MLVIALIVSVILMCWIRMTERFTDPIKIALTFLVLFLFFGIMWIDSRIDYNSYPQRMQREAEDFFGGMSDKEYNELMQQVDEVMREQRGF